MISSKVLILIALIFLNPAFSFAQQSSSTGPDIKARDTALKAKAYELLESLATQIGTLQSAENRARIGANIAGSLWPHDEKRARTLFVAVGQEIKFALKPPDGNDQHDVKTFMVFLQLRANTIDRIAKYDPEFAFEFLNTTEPSYEKMPRQMKEIERALRLRLARQIAGPNPDFALKLGRASLAQGPSEELLSLLWQLLRKHREQGVILYKETVDKIRNARFTDDYRLANFALGLARMTPPLADEGAFREFINALITTALASGCDREELNSEIFFCSQLGSIAVQMKQVDPLRTAKFEQLTEETTGIFYSPGAYAELDELAKAGDYDEILGLADKYPAFKNSVYWRAFSVAQAAGDMERAKKIADMYDGDPEDKQRMLHQIEEKKQPPAMREAELRDLLKHAESIPGYMRRFEFLLGIAVRSSINNQPVPAKLLDQAMTLLEMLKPGKEKTTALVGLATFHAMEKSDRGFAIMESLIPALNELIDAAMKLDGFDTQYVRDGEWNMSANGDLGQLLTSLSLNAGYFAWCDFDRAVSMAAQFDRAEIRMMAQLKLAQGIISGLPKRFPGFL